MNRQQINSNTACQSKNAHNMDYGSKILFSTTLKFLSISPCHPRPNGQHQEKEKKNKVFGCGPFKHTESMKNWECWDSKETPRSASTFGLPRTTTTTVISLLSFLFYVDSNMIYDL